MITFSDHARKAMEEDGVTEEEVRAALEHGKRITIKPVQGELRYTNRLGLKGKLLTVVYTFRGDAARIITCYLIHSRK